MTPSAPRIAFLTGRSDPDRCALSPVQRAMLDALMPQTEGIFLDSLNFPWNPATAQWRPVPLPRASAANAREYLSARRGRIAGLSPQAIEYARGHLLAAPRTLLLVGSCGLVLLDALIAPFDLAQRARLRIVAYGGVAPRWPRHIEGLQLRGERDRIAAWLGPNDGPPARMVAHRHMDYLDGDTVMHAVREHLPWLRSGL
jgi:hypothetical protein